MIVLRMAFVFFKRRAFFADPLSGTAMRRELPREWTFFSREDLFLSRRSYAGESSRPQPDIGANDPDDADGLAAKPDDIVSAAGSASRLPRR
jgi:hypothetical protein